MAEGRIKDTELSAIAAAIRTKNGESTTYKPAEMAQAILDIPTGGGAVIESKSITANGTYTAPTGVDGYSPVVVDVQPNLQSKTATENGTVTPDSGYDGLSSVLVNVSGGGGGADVDYTYLPASTQAKVLASADASMYEPGNFKVGTIDLIIKNMDMTSARSSWPPPLSTDGIELDPNKTLAYWLSGPNVDVTCYGVLKRRGTSSSPMFHIGVPYAISHKNDPLFDFSDGNGTVIYSSWGDGDIVVSGISSFDNHVYAISVNQATKTAKFYVDGVYLGYKIFYNSGNNVSFGNGSPIYNNSGYSGYSYFVYGGVVDECESDAVIVANQQVIMTKLGIGT